jgi:hypothetical protein
MYTNHCHRVFTQLQLTNISIFIPGKSHFLNVKFKSFCLKWTIKSIAEKETYSGFVRPEASTVFWGPH